MQQVQILVLHSQKSFWIGLGRLRVDWIPSSGCKASICLGRVPTARQETLITELYEAKRCHVLPWHRRGEIIPRRVFSNCIKPHSGLDTVTSIVEETQVTITTCFLYVSRQHTQQWRCKVVTLRLMARRHGGGMRRPIAETFLHRKKRIHKC